MRSARSCGFFKPANTILVPTCARMQSDTTAASACTPSPDSSGQAGACYNPFTANSIFGLVAGMGWLITMVLREQRT